MIPPRGPRPGSEKLASGTIRFLGTLLLGFAVLLSVVTTPGAAGAQPEHPPLELRVVDASGDPQIRSDTESAWESVRQGETVRAGSQLRTETGDTVVLADTGELSVDDSPKAGGSTYMELAPGGELTLRKLRREVRVVPDDPAADTALYNDVGLESPKGTLRIYLRPRDTVRHDFRLETLNATVGVRGTTFQCEAGDTTTCAVLEGNVRFQSRADTDKAVELAGGYASTLSPEALAPREPERMSQRARRALTRFRSRARRRICSTPIDELIEP